MYDGIDGDLVTDTPNWYISNLLRSGAWRQAWAESRLASVNHTYLRQQSALTILLKGVWASYVPKSVKKIKWKITDSCRRNPLMSSLISQDFAAKMHLQERLGDQCSVAQKRVVQESEQERHIRVLTQQGIPWSMEGFDLVAARYGIDPRHPWSDKQVIEFYLRLPLRQKVTNGWTKWLLRKATAPSLDTNICWHSGKKHLGIDLVRHLMYKNRKQILNAFKMSQSAIGEYIDIDQLNAQIKPYTMGAVYADSYQLYQIYEAISLGLWVTRDKPGQRALFDDGCK